MFTGVNTNLQDLFDRLATSPFRSRFRLTGKDRAYAAARTPGEIAPHARQMLATRLFTALPSRDGKQTPYRGHPVFVAQHATGTCCRSCLLKWHGVEKGRALTRAEEDYVVGVIIEWLHRELEPPES
jgi:hypothetical protein